MDAEDTNYNAICNEMDRQIGEQSKAYETLDNKAGVLLGFVIIVIAGVGTNKDIILQILNDNVTITLFLEGIVLLIFSTACGSYCFISGAFKVGPKITKMVSAYESGTISNLKEGAYSVIYKSILENEEILGKRSSAILFMIISFGIGIILIVFSTLIAFRMF